METIETQVALQPPAISKKIPFNLTSFKGINEYLLIVGPNGDIRRTIEQDKKEFGSNYQNNAATYGQPHITLANYIQPDITEETILQQLEIIGKEANKIKVVLNNYRWFVPHTIYINIEYQVDIKQLVRKVAAKIKKLLLVDKELPPHFILTPHLTLCKDLTIEQFEKSRLEYSDKKFSGEFVANEMILLKRPIVGTEKYIEAGRFGFGGPIICTTTQQGFLF